MNRPRLQILADHLRSLPDERVDMSIVKDERDCGTVACIMGWAETLWPGVSGGDTLGLNDDQGASLFCPTDYPGGRHWQSKGHYTRQDAISAIQSMLDSPDDDALPVWPERQS